MAPYTLKCLSLFSGIGGMELGLEMAGESIRTICYVEREGYCAEVLASRMETGELDDAPIWSDIRTFDGTAWRGCVDIITAGFPCQPHSQAGKGEGEERWLFFEIMRIAKECEAPLIFLENVTGLRNTGLATINQELSAAGYDAEWDIFTAREAGAPHQRARIFILADSNSGKSLREQGRGNGRRWFSNSNWWQTEPRMGRVAYGVSASVDKLRTLGNAVVPQQVALAWVNLKERMMVIDNEWV